MTGLLDTRTQRKIKMIIIFYLCESAMADVRFVSLWFLGVFVFEDLFQKKQRVNL
jgi:hypothetical protein